MVTYEEICVIDDLVRGSAVSVEYLEELSEHKDLYVRSFVPKSFNCPAFLLRKLSIERNFNIIMDIVSHPNCPSEILENFAILNNEGWESRDVITVDDRSLVRAAIASNASCPVKTLEELSIVDDFYTNSFIAGNPNCPSELLEKFSIDEFACVRRAVAKNPNCPNELLERLAKDSDIDVSYEARVKIAIKKEGSYVSI